MLIYFLFNKVDKRSINMTTLFNKKDELYFHRVYKNRCNENEHEQKQKKIIFMKTLE